MIIPSVLEKLGYGIPSIVLYAQKRLSSGDMVFGCVDLLLGVLFVIAFAKTARSSPSE